MTIIVFLTLGMIQSIKGVHHPDMSSLSSSVSTSSLTNSYEIVSDKTIFSRWRSIISRVVKMPNGNVVDYDVSTLSASRVLNIAF